MPHTFVPLDSQRLREEESRTRVRAVRDLVRKGKTLDDVRGVR